MDWERIDWKALERLRGAFLDGTAGAQDYWRSERDLESYDQTFGQRIRLRGCKKRTLAVSKCQVEKRIQDADAKTMVRTNKKPKRRVIWFYPFTFTSLGI